MAHDFQAALRWHMAEHDTKIADLVRETGVSRDVINKLLTREPASTTVERAILLAAYYGKSVNQFVACQPADQESRMRALFDLLPTGEQELVEAQIRGLLARRSRDSA